MRYIVFVFVLIAAPMFGQIDFERDSVSDIDYRTVWGKPVVRYYVVECDTSNVCETYKLEVKRDDTTQIKRYVEREREKFTTLYTRDTFEIRQMIEAYNRLLLEIQRIDARIRKEIWYKQRLAAIKEQI